MPFQRGPANPQWRGGVAEYPNHSEMKRIRLEKLKETRGRCEVCQELANTIHHIDGDKSNHAKSNMIAMCHRCHAIVERRHTTNGMSKYKTLYGLTAAQMAELLECSSATIYRCHYRGKLRELLLAKVISLEESFQRTLASNSAIEAN